MERAALGDDVAAGYACPLPVALQAIFDAVVAAGLGLSVDPRHAGPGVDTLGDYGGVDLLHIDSPYGSVSPLGDLDLDGMGEVYGQARCGEVGRDGRALGAEFDGCDAQRVDGLVLGDVGYHAPAGYVDGGGADLTLDAEVALYGLVGADDPVPVLVQPQSHIERRRQVDGRRQRIADHLGARGDGIVGDYDAGDVDAFAESERDHTVHGVDGGAGVLALGIECQKIGMDAGVGDVVLDTSCGERHYSRRQYIQYAVAGFHITTIMPRLMLNRLKRKLAPDVKRVPSSTPSVS